MKEVSVLTRGFGDKILKVLTRGFGKAFQLGGFLKKIKQKPIVREEEFDISFPISFYLEKILKLKFLVKILLKENVEIFVPVNFVEETSFDFCYPINISYKKDFNLKLNILKEIIKEIKINQNIIRERNIENKILIPISKRITKDFNLCIKKDMSKLIKLLEII